MKIEKSKEITEKLIALTPQNREKLIDEVKDMLLDKELKYKNFRIIWKGFFYALWASDKIINQNTLSEQLAELIHYLGKQNLNVNSWFRAALNILNREWSKIDYYRINKFMKFVRYIISNTFLYLQNQNWKQSTLEKFNSIMQEELFQEENFNEYNGLRMHYIQIFVDELSKIKSIPQESISTILKPYLEVLKASKFQTIRELVETNIFQRVAELKFEGKFRKISFEPLYESIFEVAKNDDLEEENRKSLYTVLEIFKELNEEIKNNPQPEEPEEEELENKEDAKEGQEKKKKKRKRNKKNKNKNKESEDQVEEQSEKEVEQEEKEEQEPEIKKKVKKEQKQQIQEEEEFEEIQDEEEIDEEGDEEDDEEIDDEIDEEEEDNEDFEEFQKFLNKQKNQQDSDDDEEEEDDDEEEMEEDEENWEDEDDEVEFDKFNMEGDEEEDDEDYDDEDFDDEEMDQQELYRELLLQSQKGGQFLNYSQELPAYLLQSEKEKKKYFKELNQKYLKNIQKEKDLNKPTHSKKVVFNLQNNKTKEFDKEQTVNQLKNESNGSNNQKLKQKINNNNNNNKNKKMKQNNTNNNNKNKNNNVNKAAKK